MNEGETTDLFGALISRGLARRTDPETSHEAARKVDATKQERVVLDALKDYGDMTSEEVAAVTGPEISATLQSITPRFRPLATKGLIIEKRDSKGEIVKRKGKSTRRRIVWTLTEAGRRFCD